MDRFYSWIKCIFSENKGVYKYLRLPNTRQYLHKTYADIFERIDDRISRSVKHNRNFAYIMLDSSCDSSDVTNIIDILHDNRYMVYIVSCDVSGCILGVSWTPNRFYCENNASAV